MILQSLIKKPLVKHYENKIGFLSWILDIQRTGINNYLYNLVNEMKSADSTREISLIHFKKSNDPIYKKVNDIVINSFPYNTINPLSLSRSIKELELDVLHLPSHMFPQVSPFYMNNDVKKVLTVHDLIPFIITEKLPFFYKFWVSTLKLIKNRPDFIITDSKNSKKDLIHYLKIPEEKIRVINLAPNKNFRFLINQSDVKDELKHRYYIDFPFLLYVGHVEIRKNITFLIRSYNQLLKKGINSKLVIIGKPGYGFEEISQTVESLGISQHVIFLGYVPDDDMVKFYNAAELFVFPSLYEGFGLPPLEAMACGSPVITSNTSSLPEVVGNAGFTLDPTDIHAFADAMYEILTNDSLRTEMHIKSLKQAKKFSWEKTADETWKLYDEICSD